MLQKLLDERKKLKEMRAILTYPGWDSGPPGEGWLFGLSRGKFTLGPIVPTLCWVACWWGRWPPTELPRPVPTGPRVGIAYG